MATVTKKNGDKMTVNFALFKLKQQLQLAIGEEISFSEIARQADLHRNTVGRLAANRTDRIDLATLGKLLLFFRSHGMNIEIGDLFEVTDLSS